MKNISFHLFLGLLICLAISFQACSEDDDKNENKPIEQLEGTWMEVKEECFLNDQLIKTENKNNWTKWSFNTNGEVVRYASTFSDKGTFILEGNKLKIQLQVDYNSEKSWTENMNCTILEFTNNTLTWKEPYEDDEYDYTIMYLSKIDTNKE